MENEAHIQLKSLLYASARVLLVSHWAVVSEATAKLIAAAATEME
jgi:hypothetical protein